MGHIEYGMATTASKAMSAVHTDKVQNIHTPVYRVLEEALLVFDYCIPQSEYQHQW